MLLTIHKIGRYCAAFEMKMVSFISSYKPINMNKLFLLPILTLLVTSFQLTAQSCDPDPTIPDTVIVIPLPYQNDFPERGITDTACVNTYYETTIQLRIPTTITVGPNEIAIQQVEITSAGITNLPSSFDFVCSTGEGCVYLPEEVGCIQIFGTATEADLGMHDLKINVLITTVLGALPYTLPDGSLVPGNYFFFVQPEGSPNCATVGTQEITENDFELSVKPNPFSEVSDISVNLSEGGAYQLSVFNALGSRVQNRTLQMSTGQNTFQFDGSTLPVGMYVFTLDNGQQATSGRLLIQR
jgi:hypothetical protein